MTTKTFKVALSLDNPRIIQSGINVHSFDKQSIKITIELTKNSQVYQIPTGAQIKISLLKLARQEQKIILDVPFTSADSIDWIVPDYLDGYHGDVRVGIYLIVGTENIDVGYFNITSSVSDIDNAAEEFTESVLQGWAIEDLTALLPKFQAVLDETTGKDVISAPEIILARGGATTLGERLDSEKAEVTAQLAQKASKIELEAVASGTPKGTYATLTDLQNDFPTGTTGIYVISADGNWYYWNGSSWVSGGVYQSTGIANKSISKEKLNFSPIIGKASKNLFDKSTVINGYILNYSLNTLTANSDWCYSDYIPVEASTQYVITHTSHVLFYDANKTYLSGLTTNPFTTPSNAAYVRVSIQIVNLNTYQFEMGGVSTPYENYGTALLDGSIDYTKLQPMPSSHITYENLKNETISKLLQGSQSIFTQTAIQQNNTDSTFLNRINRFFDLTIKIPNSLDAKAYKRLFITKIYSVAGAINEPRIDISYLNPSNRFVKIAEGVLMSVDKRANVSHYDTNMKYVEYTITGVAQYASTVSGIFKWERSESWNYYFNNNALNSSLFYTDTTPHIGSYEISQSFIEYYDGTTEIENTKILPKEPFYEGLLKKFTKFYPKYLKQDEDLVVIGLGESIFTANNYASDRLDAMYRPPLCHENNLFSELEEKLRWNGQEYNRFDVSGVFAETGTTKATKEYDSAWDWQIGHGIGNLAENFKPAITRVIEGTNASVSYTYPANMRRCNFIYRTDYLCAASTTVSIAEGNGKVEVFNENTQTWVEANGYSFSAKETDILIDYTRTDYTGASYTNKLRKSVYQKRLKMRSLSVLTAKTVSITNVGTGRLCYWGIEYSPRSSMIYVLNQSRGGHNISRLRAFEQWDVDDFKPDLILHQTNIINEGAMSSDNMHIGNKPSDFAQRFVTYANELKAKAYSPDMLSFTMFIGVQANIVNQSTGKYRTGYITGYGDVNVFNYIGHLDTLYEVNNITHINMFYEYLRIAEQKAKNEGTNNIWISAIDGSGTSGATFTSDDVHPNDYGNSIASTLLLPLFRTLS